MAKASTTLDREGKGFGFDGELILIALPLSTFKSLSDLGAQKGKTAAQVLDEAITAYLRSIGATHES